MFFKQTVQWYSFWGTRYHSTKNYKPPTERLLFLVERSRKTSLHAFCVLPQSGNRQSSSLKTGGFLHIFTKLQKSCLWRRFIAFRLWSRSLRSLACRGIMKWSRMGAYCIKIPGKRWSALCHDTECRDNTVIIKFHKLVNNIFITIYYANLWNTFLYFSLMTYFKKQVMSILKGIKYLLLRLEEIY